MTSLTSPLVLVYVFDHTVCARLIRAGQTVAGENNLPLEVLSIQPQGLISRHVADEVQTLHNIASGLGVKMTVLFNEDPSLAVAIHAKQQQASYLVCDLSDPQSTLFLQTIRQLLPEATVVAMEKDGQTLTFPAVAVP